MEELCVGVLYETRCLGCGWLFANHTIHVTIVFASQWRFQLDGCESNYRETC